MQLTETNNEELTHVIDLIKDKNYEQAIINLKQYVNKNQTDEIGYGLLASVYADLGMTDKAVEFYTQVLRINPDNPLAKYHLQLLRASNEIR